jgi:transposase
VAYTTKLAIRTLARRVVALDAETEEIDELLAVLVAETAPALLALHGVGVDGAATLLVAAGDNPERLRSEAAWAHLCGVSPIEASSGKVVRHRLNRGGDRQANSALWRIVMVRMVSHPPTRAYVERRTKEGRSKLEIMRMLKRYVAREVHRHLPRA